MTASPSTKKMTRQQAEAAKLDAVIQANLKTLGFGPSESERS